MSFVSLGRYISKYFILFVVMVHGIVHSPFFLYKTGSKNSNHTSNDSFLNLEKMTSSKNLSYYCYIIFSLFSVCPNFKK